MTTEVAHLRQFMVEQLHLLQATIMSKLESMDSRLEASEAHLGITSRVSPIPHPSSDPKGKVPMVSPTPSPRTSPVPSPTASIAPTPHIPSTHTSPTARNSPPPAPVPIPSIPSHSSSSSTSPSQPPQFDLAARSSTTPKVPTPTLSHDSEATASDPTHFLATPPPSPPPPPPPTSSTTLAITPYRRVKLPSTKTPSYPPSPPSPSQSSQPSPSPRPAPTPYTRRKLVVSRPGTSPPPPPSSQP